jgi:sialic acid synthase SpsE
MIPDQLVVLEMANNHMGDLDHGLRVISEFGAVCRQYPEFKFAFKLQYRDLDSFIHPAMKGRDDIKYIKRFSDTRLSESDFDTLINLMRSEGFLAMSTPFDNASIKLISKQKLDILKIASCSFNDWPLLEDAVATDFPIIASTAGADLDDIDRVISFLSPPEDICHHALCWRVSNCR